MAVLLVSNAERSGFGLKIENGKFAFHVRGREIYHEANAPRGCEADTWYHVVGTFDGYQVQLYVDGNLIAKARMPREDAPVEGRERLLIGANPDPNWRRSKHFHGWMDEVGIWKRALNLEEVRSLYRLTR